MVQTRKILHAALSLSLTLGGWAHAADPDGDAQLALGEQDFFADMPLVLTATRLPQAVSSVPAAVTVIDRQMIEASGVSDIPTLFRLVAGFQVAHDKDQRTSVTYHGASDAFARRMQVLVDGRSIYTPITGGVDWVDLPVSLEDIARIEVTRGPNGVAYGANSFLGVINIITFHPADVQGYSIKTTLGEDSYTKGTLRYAGNSGDFDYRVTVEHREDNGFRDLDLDHDGAIEVNDSQRTSALTLRGDYRATVNDYLSFQLGHSEGPRERGRSDQLTDPLRWQESEGNFQQIRWTRMHSSTEETSVQFYRSAQRHSDSYVINWPGPPVPFLVDVDNDIEMERYNLEFTHSLAPATDWRLVWGAEGRLERNQAPGYLGTPETFEHQLYRLFANAEWTFSPRWIANFGALTEDNEFNGTRTSPRLALNYLLEGGRYLRGSYTEAYRTPSQFEQEADYGGLLAETVLIFPRGTLVDQVYYSTGDLKPEHMSAYEIGFGGRSADQRASYEIKLFNEELRDLIAAYQDPAPAQGELLANGTYRFDNAGEATIRGIELQARIQPTETSLIGVAYSHAEASGRLQEAIAPQRYQDMATATPEDTLNLLLASRLPDNWQGSLNLTHVTAMRWIGGKTTAYTTADFTLRKLVSGTGGDGSLFFTVRDFLGSYFDYVDYVNQERRFYMGVELRLH